MIRKSFIFLDGIGERKEKKLWQDGIEDWNRFLNCDCLKGVSKHRKLYYNRRILEAQSNLYKFNSGYFNSILPQREMWRIFDHFKDDVVYLDIETDSIHMHGDITVFGLYDGYDTKVMIKGINLDYNGIREEL